jgi:hypothetical protein
MQSDINMLSQNLPVGTEESYDNLERNLRSAGFQSVTPRILIYCCIPDDIDGCFIASVAAWLWFATLQIRTRLVRKSTGELFVALRVLVLITPDFSRAKSLLCPRAQDYLPLTLPNVER